MKLANRTKEVEFFKQMLLGQIPKQILLIQADSGMGKTSLLAKFAGLCLVHSEAVLLVQIDLKSAKTTGIAYIFSRLQRKLGEGNFTRFNAALREFLSTGIEVSGNQIEGTENQIQVVLHTENEDIYNIRLNKLQEAFFSDLQALKKPILIIFDTFNSAPLQLANWIGGGFLAEIADIENIKVVIAGQSVPTPTIEWMDKSETHCLFSIDDINNWYSFARDKGLPFKKEEIKVFVRLLNGHPAKIMNAFESLAGGWANGNR